MPTREYYMRRAADCLRVSQQSNDHDVKVMMLEMAQAWVKLAEQSHLFERKDYRKKATRIRNRRMTA